MQTHILNLYDKYYQNVVEGEKNIECHLYDEKRKKIQIGDIIVFQNKTAPDQQISTKVIGLLLYSSFNQLFKDTHQQFYHKYSWDELQDSMLEFYSKDDEEKYGVVGIRFEIL